MNLAEIFATTFFCKIYARLYYDGAVNMMIKIHDLPGMHELNGNFAYDDFFRKTHAPLYHLF